MASITDNELRVKAVAFALEGERSGGDVSAEATVKAAKTIYEFLAEEPSNKKENVPQ